MTDFVRVPESDWQAICDAVRGKTGGDKALLSGQLAESVSGITTDPTLQDLTVTENGEYIPGEGVDGFGKVSVNVETSGGGNGGGGAAAVYDGSFTPAENMLNVTINVPGDFSKFVLYSLGAVTGNSVKATALLFCDREVPIIWGVATNNAGSSLSALSVATNPGTGAIDGIPCEFWVINNTRFSISEDNSIQIVTASPAGTCLGYFLAGVTYRWFAW